MRSCLYEGIVRHRRFSPAENSFSYRIYMLLLDLDELDRVFSNRWFWSASRFNFAWFRDEDHLKGFSGDLRDRVIDVLRENNINAPIASIRLLTQLRYAGFEMNPVSFFYCYDSNNRLVASIAEVNNTPWGEQHCYVLNFESSASKSRSMTNTINKEFHVSPFMPMDQEYTMKLSRPNRKIGVSIQNRENGDKVFDVSMAMTRTELSRSTMSRVLVCYPLISMKIFAAIYWQAIKLFAKRCPFYPHPKRNDRSIQGI